MVINGTQYVPAINQNLQQVAQQTDNNTVVASIGAIGTVAATLFGLYLKKNDTKGEQKAEADHEQNTFRLEATSSALKATNESIEATDRAAYQHARITRGILKVITQKPELKEMFNSEKIDGVGLVDFTDKFVAESANDLEEYYNRNNLPEDDFDTCNDKIVKQVTAVRNKSRK